MENITRRDLASIRKQTRAVSQAQALRLREFLHILMPLINPSNMLGEAVNGGNKTASPRTTKALADFQMLLRQVANHKPFKDDSDFEPPFDIAYTPIELHPWQYSHTISGSGGSSVITVSSPMKWIVSYANHGPAEIRAALARGHNLQRMLIHNVMLNFILTRHQGVARLLEALGFPISTSTVPDFGCLPLTCVTFAISTHRPQMT